MTTVIVNVDTAPSRGADTSAVFAIVRSGSAAGGTTTGVMVGSSGATVDGSSDDALAAFELVASAWFDTELTPAGNGLAIVARNVIVADEPAASVPMFTATEPVTEPMVVCTEPATTDVFASGVSLSVTFDALLAPTF